jgi:hemerythrin
MTRWVNLFRSRIYSVMNDDHSHLFQCLKELKRLVGGRGKSVLDPAAAHLACAEQLKLLIDDTAIHFSREEVLMRAFRFHGLDEHRNNHLSLLRSIQTYHSQFLRQGKPLTVGDLEYLDTWLTKHIREDDRKLEDFLADHPMMVEPDALSPRDARSIGPTSIAFGFQKVMLWAKLCLFRNPIDRRQRNRERAQQSAASRLRHISRQNAQAASPKQRQEEANKTYSSYYYGNY